MDEAHDLVERAVDETLKQGYRTPDIWSEGTKKVGTEEITNKIIENIERLRDAHT